MEQMGRREVPEDGYYSNSSFVIRKKMEHVNNFR